MNKRKLFIVALAGSCSVASAQVTQSAPAPVHSAPHYSHSTSSAPSSGASSYHSSGGQSGSVGYGANTHGYQNYEPSHGAGGGLSFHSLQPGETWHGDQHASWHGDQQEGWHGDQHETWRGDQHEGWHGDQHGSERDFWHGDHREGWHGDQHGSEHDFWHGDHREGWHGDQHDGGRLEGLTKSEGWWRASHLAEEFGHQASATGKEYWAAATKMAGEFPTFGDHGARDGYAGPGHEGGVQKGLPWEAYWAKIPTVGWLRDRITYLEEAAWNW